MTKKNEKKAKGILPATDQEKSDLWHKIHEVGSLECYLLDFGPDWTLLERCGVDIEELKRAVASFEDTLDILQDFEESDDSLDEEEMDDEFSLDDGSEDE